MPIFECWNRNLVLIVAHLSQIPAEGTSSSSIARSLKLTQAGSSDVLRFGEMQDRIRSLEQQLKSMKGHVDVAKSKTQLAMDEEKFLLEEMDIMSQHLECKCLEFLILLRISFVN